MRVLLTGLRCCEIVVLGGAWVGFRMLYGGREWVGEFIPLPFGFGKFSDPECFTCYRTVN